MPDIEALASEFVVAYYKSLVYRPNDVPKFYDQETAIIWRAELNSRKGVSFGQGSPFLIPEIARGSSVSVTDFNVLALEKGWSVSVWGSIVSETQGSLFNQCFVIVDVAGRSFIVSDALKLLDGNAWNLTLQPRDCVVIPSGQAQAREPRGRSQAPSAQSTAPVAVEPIKPTAPVQGPVSDLRSGYQSQQAWEGQSRAGSTTGRDRDRPREPARKRERRPSPPREQAHDPFVWFPSRA
jgi:hypothetical protein